MRILILAFTALALVAQPFALVGWSCAEMERLSGPALLSSEITGGDAHAEHSMHADHSGTNLSSPESDAGCCDPQQCPQTDCIATPMGLSSDPAAFAAYFSQTLNPRPSPGYLTKTPLPLFRPPIS